MSTQKINLLIRYKTYRNLFVTTEIKAEKNHRNIFGLSYSENFSSLYNLNNVIFLLKQH